MDTCSHTASLGSGGLATAHIPIVVGGGGVGLVDLRDGDLAILGLPTLRGFLDLPGLPLGRGVLDLNVYVSHGRNRSA